MDTVRNMNGRSSALCLIKETWVIGNILHDCSRSPFYEGHVTGIEKTDLLWMKVTINDHGISEHCSYCI